MATLVDQMLELSERYEARFGRRPVGFVVGVRDYEAIRIELFQVPLVKGDVRSERIMDVCGLPIHLKISSGIELLVHAEYAHKILATIHNDRKAAMELIRGGIVR